MGRAARHILFALLLGTAACGRLGFDPLPGPAGSGVVLGECDPRPAPADAFFVATDGDNQSGDGSAENPWRTIPFAAETVPDDSTVLVRPGVYSELIIANRNLAGGITVRSEIPLAAVIEVPGQAILCSDCSGYAFEDFEIVQLEGAPADAPVILVSGSGAERFDLRRNVIRDARQNALVRYSGGPTDCILERNVLYNAGANSMVHLSASSAIVVRDNVLFSDFAATGHVPGGGGPAYYIWVEGGTDASTGHTIARNILLRWEGGAIDGFMSLWEATQVVVESNLLIGDSASPMQAPIELRGSAGVALLHNTIVGSFPGTAFALRAIAAPAANTGIDIYNNLFADPSGGMTRFSVTQPDETDVFTLDRNLYWNGGAAIPVGAGDEIVPAADTAPVIADPGLAAVSSRPGPVWNAAEGQFIGGHASICALFVGLVGDYAVIPAGSPGHQSALVDRGATEDILRQPRPVPSIGAYELP